MELCLYYLQSLIFTVWFLLSCSDYLLGIVSAESALEHNRLPQAFLKGLDHVCQ